MEYMLFLSPPFLEAENFRFPFSAVKYEKLNFRKIVGNLLDKLRKLYMNGMNGMPM